MNYSPRVSFVIYNLDMSRIPHAIRIGRIEPAMNFQQRVWALTARIPRGRVTTYGRIADQLGSRAFRAVGMALNRNPYAPAVPCHRVVGHDGRLTGFAGGIDRKRALLIAEGVVFTPDGRVDLAESLVDHPRH